MDKEKYKDISWEEAWKDDKKLLSKVKGEAERIRSELRNYYRDMGTGEAFYHGKQYGEWDFKSISWREEEINDDDRPRLVSNQIKAFTDRAISKIVRYKPSAMTTPESNEEIDKRSCQVSQDLLHHEFREHNFDDIQERWVKMAAVTGVGVLMPYWDRFANDEVKVDSEQLAEEIKIEGRKIYKGDIKYKIIHSLKFIPDTAHIDPCDWRFGIVEDFEDSGVLGSQFPKQKDKLGPNGTDQSYFKRKTSENNQTEKTYTIYFKPCPELPNGGYAKMTQNTILEKKDKYPLNHKRLPFIILPFETSGLMSWHHGVPQPLLQLQTEYNKIRNVRIENSNYAAALKFLMPDSAQYDGDYMTNEPGEIIPYSGEVPPGWSNPMEASSELTSALQEIKEEFQTISNITPASQGKPPEGIRSGIAIQYLIENDDEVFAPIIRRMEAGFRECCYQILSMISQYYENEDMRYYKVIGANKQYQLKKFKKADLDGKYDVVIQNSNANPVSKAYKMDTILQLIQYQILDPNDRPFIAEQLELGNLKGVYENIQIDLLRARKEIDKILEGEPHKILQYDDHEAHIKEKVRYLKTEYDNLSEENIQMIQMAIQEHEQALQAMQPPMPPEGQMPPEGAPQEAMPPEGAMALGGEV